MGAPASSRPSRASMATMTSSLAARISGSAGRPGPDCEPVASSAMGGAAGSGGERLGELYVEAALDPFGVKLMFDLSAGQALLYQFAAESGRRRFFHLRSALFPPMKLQPRAFVPGFQAPGQGHAAVFIGECAIFDSIGRELVNHKAEGRGDFRGKRDQCCQIWR